MAYIPKERFVQIAVAAPLPTSDGYDLLYALDESGQVWYFNFKHNVWVPLSRNRGEAVGA